MLGGLCACGVDGVAHLLGTLRGSAEEHALPLRTGTYPAQGEMPLYSVKVMLRWLPPDADVDVLSAALVRAFPAAATRPRVVYLEQGKIRYGQDWWLGWSACLRAGVRLVAATIAGKVVSQSTDGGTPDPQRHGG
jgi:hypothetical protein